MYCYESAEPNAFADFTLVESIYESYLNKAINFLFRIQSCTVDISQDPAVLTYRIPNHCSNSQLPPVLTDLDGMVCKREGGERLMEFLEPYCRALLVGYQGHFF